MFVRYRVVQICKREDVEKIKTIGDCYMCVAWANGDTRAQGAKKVLSVARCMHHTAALYPLNGQQLSIRAGVHGGPVVSGMIGKSRFCFDIWGDTVNVASRMESTGLAGVTQVFTCSASLHCTLPFLVLPGTTLLCPLLCQFDPI